MATGKLVGSKDWTDSRGMVAPVVGAIVTLLGAAGITFTEGDVQTIIAGITGVLDLIAFAIGYIGRRDATQRIKR